MSLVKYLVIMGVATVCSWAAWVTVLFYIDPFNAGFWGLFSFYSSLFCGILGLLALFGFAVRLTVHRLDPPFKFIGISLRQGFWLAALVVLSLFLMAQGLWNIWTSGLLFLALVFLESFFLFRNKEDNLKYKWDYGTKERA